MSEEKLEKYWNKVYYDYLEQEEAEELINYYKNMEQENKQLKEKLKKTRKILLCGFDTQTTIFKALVILGDKENE